MDRNAVVWFEIYVLEKLVDPGPGVSEMWAFWQTRQPRRHRRTREDGRCSLRDGRRHHLFLMPGLRR